MSRPKYKISVSGIIVVLASAGVAPSVRSQVPSTVRSEYVPPVLGERAGAITAHPGDRPEDEKAIKQVAETFTLAFNAGDAKAVSALYTHNAELIDEFGDRIEGRTSIQDFYSTLFNERKGATIEVAMTALRFLGSDTAKEQGQTRVRPSAGTSASIRDYTVLFVKEEGRWLYASVREEHAVGVAHHERLKELEWLIGEWLDESSESIIHTTCRWSDDTNFLLRDFVIHVQGKPVMSVTQRIGWDPLSKQLKSWVFDSDGGYGQAIWTRNGNQWTIKSTGVLPDGRVVTATNVLTRTGPNAARWASSERTVGSEVAVERHESVMVRRPPTPQTQPLPK